METWLWSGTCRNRKSMWEKSQSVSVCIVISLFLCLLVRREAEEENAYDLYEASHIGETEMVNTQYDYLRGGAMAQ